MASEDPFDGVHGQDEAVTLLRRAVAGGRVSHAYVFVGPSGSGRKLTAMAFARALVAPAGGPSAARIERGAHPDVRLIQPTPPENNPKGPLALRIENVRALERLAALRPAEAAWKVFVVDEAERMTAATPQAFLKTLEEPPVRTVIILILSQLRALPPTVVSRCEIVRFRPRHAEGTIALLPDGREPARRQALRAIAEARDKGIAGILEAGEEVGRDRAMAEALVESCWLRYRDLLCAQVGADPGLLVFPDEQQGPGARCSLDDVLSGLSACREAWLAIQGNVSPRLTVEVLLNRLAMKAA